MPGAIGSPADLRLSLVWATTDAIGIVVLVIIIHTGRGEGDRVEVLLAFILPDSGFNAPKAKGLTGRLELAAAFFFCEAG